MAKFFDKLLAKLHVFLVGDFKQLLIFLLILFIFRPYNLGVNYLTIWHLFFTGVLLAAIFNCHHTMKVQVMALVLGIPTFILNWWSLFQLDKWIFVAGLTFTLLFLIFAIFSLLNRVLLSRVNADVLRGTVCVYFMIGFAFSVVYTIIELLYPGSFHGLVDRPPLFPHGHYHSDLVYFSFVTLLAIGYGDIVPISDVTQVFAVLEGLIGQFYLAILVARLVGTYTMRAKARAKT